MQLMKAAVKLEETNIYKCFSSLKEVNDWYNIIAETLIMNLKRLDIHDTFGGLHDRLPIVYTI